MLDFGNFRWFGKFSWDRIFTSEGIFGLFLQNIYPWELPKEGQTLHCELFSGNKIVQYYGYSSFAVIRYNFLQKKCLYEVALTQKAKNILPGNLADEINVPLSVSITVFSKPVTGNTFQSLAVAFHSKHCRFTLF